MEREIKYKLLDKEGKLIGYEIHQKNEFGCWQIYHTSVRYDWNSGNEMKLVREGYFISATYKFQYTGLKDINETEVYEGDIIENCDTKTLQIVYWNEDEAAWYCRYVDDEKRIVSLSDSLGNLNKVVGNVFENAEPFR